MVHFYKQLAELRFGKNDKLYSNYMINYATDWSL